MVHLLPPSSPRPRSAPAAALSRQPQGTCTRPLREQRDSVGGSRVGEGCPRGAWLPMALARMRAGRRRGRRSRARPGRLPQPGAGGGRAAQRHALHRGGPRHRAVHGRLRPARRPGRRVRQQLPGAPAGAAAGSRAASLSEPGGARSWPFLLLHPRCFSAAWLRTRGAASAPRSHARAVGPTGSCAQLCPGLPAALPTRVQSPVHHTFWVGKGTAAAASSGSLVQYSHPTFIHVFLHVHILPTA